MGLLLTATGRDGPTLVLLHGLLMDASLWDNVIAGLSVDHQRVARTLPLGAHRKAMRPDADLSRRGIARLVGELLGRLDLHDVTVASNETGGAFAQLLVCDGAARVSQIVLASCAAFNNPPGLNAEELLGSEGARILLRTVAGDGKPTPPGRRHAHDHSRGVGLAAHGDGAHIPERAKMTALDVIADGEPGSYWPRSRTRWRRGVRTEEHPC